MTLMTTTDSPGDLLEVPVLMGKTVEEAKALVGENFKIQSDGAGIIQSQIPKAGTKIGKGNKIIVKTTE